jgi:hypothetical protein
MRCSQRLLLSLTLASVALLLGEAPAHAQRAYYGPAYGPPRGYYRGPAYAAQPYYGFHTHDGFFMRLNVGAGYLRASETYGGLTDRYAGMGVTFCAAFGGALTPNLVIYGEMLGTSVPDPEWSVSDGSGRTLGGVDMTMAGIGPGIAYYVLPINLYLSGTLTFDQISFSASSSDYSYSDTSVGIGLSLMVGKEWWISRDWGLGLAGQMHIASMGDNPGGYSTRMSAAVFSVLLSATYN